MKRFSLLLLPLAALAGAGLYLTSNTTAQAQDAAAPKPMKALLVLGGCCHDYKTQKDILKAGLEQRLNIEVTLAFSPSSALDTKFPEYEKADWAKGYDVVIHDECSANVKDLEYVNRVLQPHRDGVPGVNLHCAMHSYRTAANVGKPVEKNSNDSLWFDYIGMQSSGHGPQKPITLTWEDKTSPIVAGLQEWTTINEELYNNIQHYDTAKPIIRGKQDAGDKVGSNNTIVAWTNEYGAKKTRVFSTTLGHNNATVSDDKYLDLVARGILWATDKINADGSAKAGYAAAKAAAK
jgi:type 1 glutamine amidotransferase